jgi:ring-1,2-phenylacetyl-CoA epoxidase subunit PaaE
MVSFTLKVVEIRRETSDTVTLCLKQPNLKKVKYLPGQYLTLIFHINGRKYIRPYSFSSAPGVDQHLEITVKRVSGGIVSNYINDFVEVGNIVEVIPPMGDFVFDRDKINTDKHIILWGAGSGITPLVSIAKYILHNNTGNKVQLFYGNRNMDSMIFRDQILRMGEQFYQNFRVLHFHSGLNTSGGHSSVIEGRINPDLAFSIIKDQVDLDNTVHYICGPTGLKESIKNTLKISLVPDENVFYEDFEIEKNTADFEGISTRFIEILKNGSVNKVEVKKGKSILNAGLDASIDLDYSCQTGSCLLCKGKVLRGNVKMIGLKNVSDKLLEDECLMCCGYPFSDDVKISIL